MTNQAIDSRWVRYRSIAYLRGKGLSFGVGPEPIYPKLAIDEGKFSLNVDIYRHPGVEVCGQDLSVIAKGSLDHVFVGNRLQQFSNPQTMLANLVEKLREGGHIIIHTVGGSTSALREALRAIGSWQEKDTYEREGQVLGIWKLLGKQRREVRAAKPRAAKRACICRYGAIGDMIMISPLIRKLHEDGYEVTMNITPYCAEVIKQNPFVANVVLQERDAIPNQDLGEYWKEWLQDYDKYINLSESIEGKLLKVEGRRDFFTTKAWRSERCGDVNYYDQTMRLGGYPDVKGTRGELFFSPTEEKAVKKLRDKFKDKFLILWALRGSSFHKQYPLLQHALGGWLDKHPDALALLAGAPQDAQLGFTHQQVINTCGQLPLREVFALTKYVDLVGGPETAITNAAGCFATPKLVLLSHSSRENLCKYWENDFSLEPEGVPCYPCHQLHYTKESCPLVKLEVGGREAGDIPACSVLGVTPERLQARLDEIYSARPSIATL